MPSPIYAVRTSLSLGTGVQEAVRIPVEGGPAEILAPLGHTVNDVREGGDGKLYWGELSAHAMRLMRAPLGDLAHPERLPTPLVTNYQIDSRRLGPRQLLMHPGPVNRGIELSPEVIDGPASLITTQVESGLVVRMAVLYELLAGGGEPRGETAGEPELTAPTPIGEPA